MRNRWLYRKAERTSHRVDTVARTDNGCAGFPCQRDSYALMLCCGWQRTLQTVVNEKMIQKKASGYGGMGIEKQRSIQT